MAPPEVFDMNIIPHQAVTRQLSSGQLREPKPVDGTQAKIAVAKFLKPEA
jgi:hypothetical protein